MEVQELDKISFKYLNEEKKYKVYENGVIQSAKNDRVLNTSGYIPFAKFSINNVKITKPVCTLVYELFVGKVPDGFKLFHKDGDTNNCNLNNLDLMTIVFPFDETIWKRTPEYKYYVANRQGDIMSLLSGKILTDNYSIKFPGTYIQHRIMTNEGKRISRPAHYLIYTAYYGLRPEKLVIDHLNQNSRDNRVENLRAVTVSVNNTNRIRSTVVKNTDEIFCQEFINLGTRYRGWDLSKYSINRYGQLNNKDGLLMKPNPRGGYLSYKLYDKSKGEHSCSIHQLVATIFLDNPNNYDSVNHLDEDRHNNLSSNLAWTTRRLNTVYSCGKRVQQFTLEGVLLREFDCIADAGRFIGKPHCENNIGKACQGKTKKAYGCKWNFVKLGE